MKKLLARIRPAFDELGVWGVTLVTLYLSPAIVNPAWRPLAPDWRTAALSIIITGLVLIRSELDGTAETKRIPHVKARRYWNALLLALAVGMGSDRVVSIVEGLLPGILG